MNLIPLEYKPGFRLVAILIAAKKIFQSNARKYTAMINGFNSPRPRSNKKNSVQALAMTSAVLAIVGSEYRITNRF